MDFSYESNLGNAKPFTAPEPIDNIMPPLANTARLYSPPDVPPAVLLAHGIKYCQPSDQIALTAEQRAGQMRRMHADRLADREYLRTHPEVQAIVQLIFAQLEKHRPVQMGVFMSDYFQMPIVDLRVLVQQQLDRLQSSRENVADADGDSECRTPDPEMSASTTTSSW